MKKFIIFCLIFALSIAQNFPDCSGKYQNLTIVNQQPTLLNSTTNGKKYIIQAPNDNTTYVYLAVLKGTPYEMGYAYGALFKEEIQFVLSAIHGFFKIADQWIGEIPQWMHNLSSSASDSAWLGDLFEQIATAHFTPQRYFDELKGMSDATGIDYNFLVRMNLFPELIRASCSIAGVWNPASKNGTLLQLRALDWVSTSPMNEYPVVTIYHSTEDGSNPHANIGWAGMVGTLAGYSSKVGVSEKLWYPFQDNLTTIFGEPWMYVLRDVLQFANNLDEAISMIESARKTYQIFVGVGSKADNQLRGFQYSKAKTIVYSDKNWSLPFSSAHPQMNGILYWDKTVSQTNACFAEIFQNFYGNIDWSVLSNYIAPMDKTGDTLLAIYDFGANAIYLSFAHYQNNTPAFIRPRIFLNMTQLFSLPVNDAEDIITI